MLSCNDIRFHSDFFAVILLYIEDNSNLSFGKSNSENLETGYFIIKNILEELSARKHVGYATEVNGMITWLFNYQEPPKPEERNEIILDILNTARDIFQNKFQIYTTISVSSVHETYKEIPLAYYEALEAMEFRAIKDIGSVIFYDEVKSYRSNKYNYTFDSEYKMINYIKTGDYEMQRVCWTKLSRPVMTKFP